MEDISCDSPYLEAFLANNKHCHCSIVDGEYHIDTPWGSEDCRLVFNVEDVPALKQLPDIVLDPRFDAIIHKGKKLIEFVFTFLNPTEESSKGYLDRSFKFIFLGKEHDCYFIEPSEALFTIARAFRRLPSEGPSLTVPQMLAFRDYQRIDKLPGPNKKYFEGKQPRNFYLSLPNNYPDADMVRLTKHLNFIMRWFDRESPEIIVRTETSEASKKIKPSRYFQSSFPETISLRQLDDVVLTLIDVAKDAGPRFSFLYYYQVLEYSGYYYLDDKIRKCQRSFQSEPFSVVKSEPPCPHDWLISTPSFPTFPRSL